MAERAVLPASPGGGNEAPAGDGGVLGSQGVGFIRHEAGRPVRPLNITLDIACGVMVGWRPNPRESWGHDVDGNGRWKSEVQGRISKGLSENGSGS